MDFKRLKINVASVALAVSLSAGGSLVLSTPAFAMDDNVDETTIENTFNEDVNLDKENIEAIENSIEEANSSDEVNEEVVEETIEPTEEIKDDVVEETVEPTEQVKEDVVEEPVEATEEVKEDVIEEPVEATQEVKEDTVTEKSNVLKTTSEDNESTPVNNNSFTVNDSVNQDHTVSVVTNKVDENGNPLAGATLQIIDKDGNVVDEWISDGTEHISLIPEGEYTLHEVSAPEGYVSATDRPFTVSVEVKDLVADVEHDGSHDVCWHYGGVPLYYIESEGVKEEVYCINQNWDEPDGINYDGVVLDEDNIRLFTPDADVNMSDNELYNKVLDIIYHRSKAEEYFPELTETEIRFITEYALKTFTSAEVTTRQAMRDEHNKIIRDEDGNIVYEDIKFLRQYRYDPNSPKGYVEDRGNGDGIGKLAEHWYNQHGHSRIPEEYVQLFYYLVNDVEKHPEDMFLYIYSTKNPTVDGESYQNLVGVRWFDPYDDEFQQFITLINEKDVTPPTPPTPPEPEEPVVPDKPVVPEEPIVPEKPVVPVTPKNPTPETIIVPVKSEEVRTLPQTGDETNLLIPALACLGSSATALGLLLARRKEKQKVKKM